jgi:uncharacterized membrane-anchored protein
LPVIATLYMLLGAAVMQAPGWGLSALLLASSVGVLMRQRPIFVSCLAVVGLVVALIWLTLLVMDGRAASLAGLAAMHLALTGVCAALVRPRWVLQALGAMLVLWAMLLVLSPFEHGEGWWQLMWWPIVGTGATAVLALLWGLWVWREARSLGTPAAARGSALADGFAVGLLAMALVSSWDVLGHWGMLINGPNATPGVPAWWLDGLMRWPCVLVPLAGAALAQRWRAQQRPEAQAQEHARDEAPAHAPDQAMAGRTQQAAHAPVPTHAPASAQSSLPRWVWFTTAWLTLLSAWVPGLAVIGVLAALAAATARWRLLASCGLAALVCLSRFYGDLNWSLTTKAAVMAAAGLLLGLTLWLAHVRSRQRAAAAASVLGRGAAEPQQRSAPHPAPQALGLPWRWATPLVGLLGALCLLLVNVDVWRKETVVARGEPIYVPLVPVDPRSLMQGDYMDLRFELPRAVETGLNELADRSIRREAQVVVGLNVQQRATVLRLAQAGETLAANERLMPIKHLKGRWVLVTDAYFFPEGEGERFEAARFGEFRVLPDGRALLIGLSDAEAKPIRSPHDLRD